MAEVTCDLEIDNRLDSSDGYCGRQWHSSELMVRRILKRITCASGIIHNLDCSDWVIYMGSIRVVVIPVLGLGYRVDMAGSYGGL